MHTRRQFVEQAPLGLLAVIAACRGGVSEGQAPTTPAPAAGPGASASTPGAPPTFGTAPAVGPEVTAGHVRRSREAGRSDDHRRRARRRRPAAGAGRSRRCWSGGPGRGRWRCRSRRRRRRGGTRCSSPPEAGPDAGPVRPRHAGDPGPLPSDEAAIAYAPVAQLSRWIESRKLTSERLTRHLPRPDRAVRSASSGAIITLTRDHALEQAQPGRRGDRRRQVPRAAARHPVRREGPARHRGHPHDLRRRAVPATGCPRTTRRWCARLYDAGAVLIAKLSLGALALNDIWFGGQTMNPWLLEEGASGSSAGPGAATAAALVGFSIGSETGGSIVVPGHALRHHRPPPDLRPRARARGR